VTRAWRPGRWHVATGLLALGAYLVLDLRVFPLSTRFPDEQRFIDEALGFARTGQFWVWDDRAFEMPLIGLIYGFIYRIAGSEAGLIAGARVLQAVLLVIQAWLCADLARRLFSRDIAASLAFFAVLAYPMFVAFQALLLSEAVFIFLLVLAMWWLYRWADTPTTGWLVAYAASMAAATYAKASLTWLPLLLPVLLLPPPLAWRPGLRVAAVTALVYCICLSPWWVRNAKLFGHPILFTTSASSNLYLGNNPANLTAGNDWERDAEQPFVSANGRLPEVERDRHYRERALAYIHAEPAQFVRNAGRKFVRFWNIFPNHESFQGAYRWIVALSYGPALALALLAAWLYRERWRRFMPMYALFAYFTLVHSITIASLRYRLPLEPFLVVFAAGAAAWLWSRERDKTARLR